MEMMMSFLSYKVLRSTCLRFPEQLEVVVTGDVLQQWLPACSMALAVLLSVQGQRRKEIFKIFAILFSKYKMGNCIWLCCTHTHTHTFHNHLPCTFPSVPYWDQSSSFFSALSPSPCSAADVLSGPETTPRQIHQQRRLAITCILTCLRFEEGNSREQQITILNLNIWWKYIDK